MPALQRKGNGKTADGTLRSWAHLLGQIDYAGGDHVKISRFSFVRHAYGTIAELVGAINESRAETIAAGSLQIVDVGSAHHHFLRLQAEIIVSRDVYFAVRLVVPDQFGAENGVPRKTGGSGQAGHQSDIAVRERRDQVLLLYTREAVDGIRPGFEPAPDVSPGNFFFFGEAFNFEFNEQFFEDHSMQIIESGPGDLALTYLVHRRFVSEAPAVGKGDPVDIEVFGLAPGNALGNYRTAPVHNCAEYIEDERFHVGQFAFHFLWFSFRLPREDSELSRELSLPGHRSLLKGDVHFADGPVDFAWLRRGFEAVRQKVGLECY